MTKRKMMMGMLMSNNKMNIKTKKIQTCNNMTKTSWEQLVI